LQPVIFVVRRLGIVLACVVLKDWIFFQVLVMIIMQVVATSFNAHVRPFLEHDKYHLEMLNELTVSLMVYHIICFTPYNQSIEAQDTMGWSLNLVLCGNLVINVGLIAISVFKDCMVKVRQHFAAKR